MAMIMMIMMFNFDKK